MAATGTAAACSKVTFAGFATTAPLAGRATYSPNRFNRSGKVGAEHDRFCFEAPAQPTCRVGHPRQWEEVDRVDGGGMDPHQHAVFGDRRPLDFIEFEDIGAARLPAGDRFHAAHALHRWPFTPITRSHSMSDASAAMPRTSSGVSSWFASGGERKVS